MLNSSHGDGRATQSGYAKTARLWRRGTDAGQAPVLFEAAVESVSANGAVDRTQASETIWFVEARDFFDADVWLGDSTGARTKLDLPPEAQVSAHRGWLAIRLRTGWSIGERTYPIDSMLAIPLASFLAGDRAFSVLFEPAPRRALQTFFWCNGQLILSILDDLQPVFEVLLPSDGSWTRAELSGLPRVGVVDVWPLDADESESNGDLLVSVQDPLTPSSLMFLPQGRGPVVLKRSPPAFNADELVVTRHEAVSVDGERIPYVQTGPARETGNNAPVHLTGYGGFGMSTKPYYNPSIGKLWLEQGGTSVTANIRGGGEFGTRWHDAGRGAAKRLSHDDFAAVAADLVRRGVTQPRRIAGEGGSNGGLLIANMLTRYPERFGALFCTIPLIDMRRYSKLLAGASWIAEYGAPDKPEDWAFLRSYSAYHQAAPGRLYPPILIATTRRDDRVHPGHARKMTAKLQAMGYGQAYFYEPAAGGHGYGKDNKERAAFSALGYAFLKATIGWPDR